MFRQSCCLAFLSVASELQSHSKHPIALILKFLQFVKSFQEYWYTAWGYVGWLDKDQWEIKKDKQKVE